MVSFHQAAVVGRRADADGAGGMLADSDVYAVLLRSSLFKDL